MRARNGVPLSAAKRRELGLTVGADLNNAPLEDSCKVAELARWSLAQQQLGHQVALQAEATCNSSSETRETVEHTHYDAMQQINGNVAKFSRRCEQYTAQQQRPMAPAAPVNVSAPVNPAQLMASRQAHGTDLERQGQLAAVSCWGGFSDLAAKSGQPALASWANDHASWLSKNGVRGCPAQQTMSIAPGCNAEYPISLRGGQCQGGNVGWTIQTPSGEPACCVKATLRCRQQWELAQ